MPSTAQDLQWSSNQRFKGPVPERDITAYGPPGGCPQVYYFAPPSGTIASGSHTLTITGGAYAATNGCGVAVYGAGPNSSLSTPGTVTVAAHTYTGSTTYCYEVAAADNNLGMSVASAHTCISNGAAALGRDSYNFLHWTTVTNAVAYVIYESATSGGTYTAIGTSYVAAYCDMGFASAPVPDFAPSTAPSAVTPQALFTTISSGGGTSTLTLAAAASNSATSQPVYQDDSWMLAAALSALSVNTDGYATILVIPPGLFWFPHLPANWNATWVPKIEQRGTVYLTGLPIFGNPHWIGYGGSGGAQNMNAEWSPIYVSSHVGAVFVTSAGDIENIASGGYGDGIVVLQGTAARIKNINMYMAANAAGSPLRFDGNVIGFYGDYLNLVASQATGGPPAIWFNAETTTTADSDVRLTRMWISYHSVKADAPVGALSTGHQLVSLEYAQTESNYDHGFIVDDDATIYGIELRDIAQDSNYSNYNPTVLSIGAHAVVNVYGDFAGVGMAATANGATGVNTSGRDAPVSAINTRAGAGVAGGGRFTPNLSAGQSIGSSGGLLFNNLAVLDSGGQGDVQWGQLVSAFPTSQFTVSTSTSAGSLAAGTYYYMITCVNPDGGETLPTGEVAGTLASTGEITIAVNHASVAGCIGGAKVYRGTTSGGENVWLNKSSTYYTFGTGGMTSTGFTDDGTYTSNSASPPTASTAFHSVLKTDVGSFSYLLADQPALYNVGNTRLGIGTMIDPGSGSGIKLDVAGGTVRGQSGFVAGTSDPAFTNSPRGIYHAFLPALTATATGATLTLDRGVTLTRVQAQAITAPSGCSTNAVVRVSDGTTPVNVTVSAAANDSGAITQNYAAGTALTISVSTAATGCSTSPANVNVEVQYRMQ